MSEHRLRVDSGPPQQMAGDADGAAPSEPAAADAGATQQVKQAAAPAKEKARELAAQARSHAQTAAGQAKDQAAARVDEQSTQLGRQIGSQGEALDGIADELRRQGNDGPAKVAEQAADKVKNLGDHLERADGEQLVDSARRVARDNPAAAAAVGAAAGFAAGRVIKASLGDEPEPAAHEPGGADPGRPGTGAA